MKSLIKTERCEFLVDNLDFEEATGIAGARPEYFQLSLWNDDSVFRHDNKSRQIAYSWSCAANAIARAILDKRDAIFISINQEESQEKIRYANRVYDAIRVGRLPERIRSSLSEVELSNGARITSFPAKAARGRSGADIYLDEFAHVRDDKIIYTGSLPVVSKGGRVWMGSSPLGSSGVFWEVGEQKLRRYPGYNRKTTPWWEIYSFCTNVRLARAVAPGMLTRDRVERFGKDRIRDIFENMPEEDFQQEYECAYVDETTAWITWDEIRQSQTDPVCFLVEAKDALVPEVFEVITKILQGVRLGVFESAFAVGIDIGRTKNTTEIFGVGLSTTGQFPLRFGITLDNIKFEDQLEVILAVLQFLPVVTMLIDETGIGRNLAENAHAKFPVKVQPMTFTNARKQLWATDAKMLFAQGKVQLPNDKDLAYQIHSIKKLVTPSKLLSFDTARNEKHHADKFWALALALAGAYHPPEPKGEGDSQVTASRQDVDQLFGATEQTYGLFPGSGEVERVDPFELDRLERELMG